MTRIYEIPRYKDQTKNKLKVILSINKNNSSHFVQNHMRELADIRGIYETKRADIVIDELNLIDNIMTGNIFDEDEKYAYREKVLEHVPFASLNRISAALDDIIKDDKNIIMDDTAMFKLVIDSVVGKEIYGEMPMNRSTRRWADNVAKDLTLTTLLAAKVGTIGIKKILKDVVPSSDFGSTYKNWVNGCDYYEKLLLGSVPESIFDSHQVVMNTSKHDIVKTDFAFNSDYFKKAKKNYTVYKIIGFLIFQSAKVTYIFDNSALTQVYQCMRWWANYAIVTHNYRLSGDPDRESLFEVNASIIRWLNSCDQNVLYKIPRHMKVTHNIMMNEFHNLAERESLGSRDRIAKMMTELNDHIVSKTTFYSVLTSSRVSDRLKMDLSYIFHGLPSPDCDGELLMKELHNKTHTSNEVNDSVFDLFMRYSKSFDLSAAARKFKKAILPYIIADEGYNIEEESWFRACLKGENAMPPVSDMGKAYLSGFFKHEEHMEYWYLEAADATHVASDYKMYSTISELMKIPKHIHNELLYTLKYGDKLHMKYKPGIVREKLAAKENFADWIAIVAAKSENTKYGEKVRETLSASDIAREATSDMDRCANKVTKLGSASTMRMPITTMNAKFKDITDITRMNHNDNTLIMSLDVSGWSPNANRKYMFEHIRYVLGLTEGGNDIDYEHYWNTFKILIHKRGSYVAAPGDSGMYQGFTGTLDTALHQHMLFFAVRMAKEAGILTRNEAAYGMCLIDDGVIAIDMDKMRSKKEVEETSKRFAEHVISVYSLLGFKIDGVKTLVSNTKYVYLNRFFADGSEVLMPTKVLCKMDRELNRKFSTIREQIQSVFGSGCSAVIKGADPILTYYMAITRSMQLLAMTHRPVMALSADTLYTLCLAPRNVGGLNIPSIHEWISGSITDHYLHFAYITGYIHHILKERGIPSKFYANMRALYDQTFRDDESLTLLNNIRDIRYDNVAVPESIASRVIRESVIKYAKAPHYKETLKLSVDQRYVKSIYKAVRCMQIDASVLEELMNLTPLSSIQGVVAKCTRNELFNCLMKPTEKTKLMRTIRKKDIESITRAIELMAVVKESDYPESFSVDDAYAFVKDKRDAYYEAMDLKIVNHTVTDPSFFLVRSNAEEPSTVYVDFKHAYATTSDTVASTWNHTSSKLYNNLYDGRCMNGIYPGTIIQGIMTSGANTTRDLNPIKRTVVNAACLSAYVMDKGNDGGALFAMISSFWGSLGLNKSPVVTKKIDPTASTKRLGESLSSVSNQVVCYPNCNNLVEVDTTNLGRYLDESSMHVNFMSIVVCAKISGLLEYGANREKPNKMAYNLALSSECVTDKDICMLIDGMDEAFDKALEEISSIAPDVSREWFRKAVDEKFEQQDIPDGIAEGITMVENDGGAVPAGGLAELLMSSRSEIIQKGIVVRRRTSRVNRSSDQIYRRKRFSAKDRFRELVKVHRLPEPNAALSVAVECAGIKGKAVPPDSIYPLSKAEMHTVYDDVFGNMKVEEVLNVVGSVWTDPYIWKGRYPMEGLNKDMRRVICGMPVGKSVSEEDETKFKRGACVCLYSMYHGRLLNTDQYRFASTYDAKFYARTQKFAMKRSNIIAGRESDATRRDHRRIAAYMYKAKSFLNKPFKTYQDLYSFVDSNIQAALKKHINNTATPLSYTCTKSPGSTEILKAFKRIYSDRARILCRHYKYENYTGLLDIAAESLHDLSIFSFGDIRYFENEEYRKRVENELKFVDKKDMATYSTLNKRISLDNDLSNNLTWYGRRVTTITGAKSKAQSVRSISKQGENSGTASVENTLTEEFYAALREPLFAKLADIEPEVVDGKVSTKKAARNLKYYCISLYLKGDIIRSYRIYKGKEAYDGTIVDEPEEEEIEEFDEFISEQDNKEKLERDEK